MIQTIILSVIAGVVKSILLGLVGFFFKSKLLIMRILGFLITFGALGTLTFMILVAAALTVIKFI